MLQNWVFAKVNYNNYYAKTEFDLNFEFQKSGSRV